MRFESAARLTAAGALFAAAGLLPLAGAAQNQRDPGSGLIIDEGWQLVNAHCGACHALGLVTQNRGDAQHWARLIHWMQEEQGLWELGNAEPTIVEYLARNYGEPDTTARREPLKTEWLRPQTGE